MHGGSEGSLLLAWIEVKLRKQASRDPWTQGQVTALSSSAELHQEGKIQVQSQD